MLVISLSTALTCYAATIYFENRGEPKTSQVYTGLVVKHRATDKKHRFPKTVCGVVKQKNQFEWVKGKNQFQIAELDSWEKSIKIAKGLSMIKDPIPNAIFFNHIKRGKKFKTPMKPVVVAKTMYY